MSAYKFPEANILENLLLQRQFSHQVSQADILPLELLQALGLLNLQPAIFPAPAVVALLRDLGLLAGHCQRLPLRQ